jgi:hypothetical protein
VTGYMYGKGKIVAFLQPLAHASFASRALFCRHGLFAFFGVAQCSSTQSSKSANYCCTNKTDNTGVLLLAEVALGQMYELTQAKYMVHA